MCTTVVVGAGENNSRSLNKVKTELDIEYIEWSKIDLVTHY